MCACVCVQMTLHSYRYGELEKEVKTVFDSCVSHSRELTTRRAAAKWLLERMKFFLYSETDTIPRVIVSLLKTKLCVLSVLLFAGKAVFVGDVSSLRPAMPETSN